MVIGLAYLFKVKDGLPRTRELLLVCTIEVGRHIIHCHLCSSCHQRVLYRGLCGVTCNVCLVKFVQTLILKYDDF